jgi:hypothetical protein
MVMPVVTKIYRPIKRSLAIPAGMVGALVVGLSTTAAEPGTLESQPTVPATSAAVEQAVADAPIGLSLNLGDILENVFRYVQVSTISDQEEVQLGQEINRMLLSQQYRLYNDSQVQRYVEQLGQQLVAASDSRDIPYNFQVVVSDNVNAFAVPGGYIYVLECSSEIIIQQLKGDSRPLALTREWRARYLNNFFDGILLEDV